jgi:hypothetical protein
MTVIIIFTISYFSIHFYVFSGRSESSRGSERASPRPVVGRFEKSTNKIFFFEIFVEFHILEAAGPMGWKKKTKMKKPKADGFSVTEWSSFRLFFHLLAGVLSCHRPIMSSF